MTVIAKRPAAAAAHGPRELPRLGDGFLFGTATAAYQVEKGLHRADWSQWERSRSIFGKPRVEGGDRADDGPDFLHLNPDGSIGGRYKDYLAEAKAMGHNAFRFSLEWSRLQPDQGGPYDPKAIAMYRALLDECRANGLTPMVTLQHFSLPTWVNDVEHPERGLGGWGGRDGVEPGQAPIVDAFAQFAGDMSAEFGDQVDLWITLNELSAYNVAANIAGLFPGAGMLQLDDAWRANINMAYAHARAYDAIKARDAVDADGRDGASSVGLAQHLRTYEPRRPDRAADVEAAKQLEAWMNALPIDAATTGDVDWNADGDYDDPHEGRGVAELRDRLDFVGVNYYTRTKVTGFPFGLRLGWGPLKFRGVPLEELPFIGQFFRPPNPTDMGWEVYPEGLHDALLWASHRYGKPLYVTENGIAEGSAPDVRRPRYILDHVEQVQRAIADGADVRGYLHWSLMDNFEWAFGFRPRFGLLRVDRTDPARPFQRTRGAEAFSDVIRERGVTPAVRGRWTA